MFITSYKQLTIKAKTIFWIIIILAMALGVISLQTRHKAVLIPFFYIAIAYIYGNISIYKNKKNVSLALLFPFIVAQLIYCYLHF